MDKMDKIKRFEDLIAWQKARELTKQRTFFKRFRTPGANPKSFGINYVQFGRRF